MHLYRLIPILMSLMLLTLSTAHANPPTGAVTPVNSITGSASGDQVGLGGVYVLPSGNIVIVSPQWNVSRGAVTCLTPSEYQAGNIVVSAGNSLTGENIGSRVGNGGITILANGNYVVSSPNWGTDPSGLESQGAATWVDGKTCLPFGEATRNALVNSANSLVGVSSTDQVSSGGVVALNNNANYVVISPKHAGNSGAVTWVNGQTGLSGGISDTNSLVGASNLDQIGSKGVVTLTNGNYVVVSPLWDRSGITDTGAVTWVNGKTGAPVGLVSQTNSLVGTTANDRIGDTGVLALSNGNYVVQSISWDNGSTPNVGAVTWGDGKLGTKGAVGTTNSIVGLGSNDALGGRVIPLTNGNYLVIDDDWNSVGAVRWASGSVVSVGKISTSNALYGSSGADTVGQEVVPLPNGNYVVLTPLWNNGAVNNVGAVTWGNGNGGIIGPVNAGNSLIGFEQDDRVGSRGIVILSNGNYVVRSELWHATGGIQYGAVTWCPATSACTGVVSAANSLVGSTDLDRVGAGADGQVWPLTNGNYVVFSPTWNGQGALTWANGATGITGTISAANSLLDITTIHAFTPLTNGNYVFAINGAVRFALGNAPITGTIDATNALVDANILGGAQTLQLLALPNGNYVVAVGTWTTTEPEDAFGAVVWGDGTLGTVGAITADNALMGKATYPVGQYVNPTTPPVTALPDSNYFIRTVEWDSDTAEGAGAVSYSPANGNLNGFITEATALVGSNTNDRIGAGGLVVLPDGGALVVSPTWNNVGAVTYVAGAANLLQNGGFELAGSTTKLATKWKGANLQTNDKRICSTAKKPLLPPEGSCIFQFKASSKNTFNRSIKQTIPNPVWGFAGDQLTFYALIEGVNLLNGAKTVLINIKYIDNTVQKMTLTIPAGSYAYAPLSQSATLTGRVKSVAVTIKPGKIGGQLRLDNVRLTIAPAPVLRFPRLDLAPTTRDGTSPMGLPTPPDGFRQ